ncbi:hypothetical protein [Streptomyces sp. ME19-01-6]|uniref:hypothetical protein n=1 Tax=Streptomyces sp. ME19-01-6 TaxID=3028686 RepID=UPI0029B8A91C|nr:hypothetical protein [Streptomyces sp. ME19-01-6]MDX3233624.1 hypothetical protein [Streptomyces sp. ME19-01-6]
MALSTSARTIRPPGALPGTVVMSMPCSLAIRRASGEVATLPGSAGDGAGVTSAAGAGVPEAGASVTETAANPSV